MSQEAQILQHLKKSPITPIITPIITPMEALSNYGCLRLAARISDLRERGHKIETVMVDQGKKRFARYHLKK